MQMVISLLLLRRKLIELENGSKELLSKATVAELSEEKPEKGDEQFIALVGQLKMLQKKLLKNLQYSSSSISNSI